MNLIIIDLPNMKMVKNEICVVRKMAKRDASLISRKL